MRFCVKEYSLKNSQKAIGIGIRDNNGYVFPSPLTNFIKKEYRMKGNSINSQRAVAYSITRMFNFFMFGIESGKYTDLKFNGLKALTLEHVGDYITHLSLQNHLGKKDAQYITNDLKYIIKFLMWLDKEKIINIPIKPNKVNSINYSENKEIFELNDVEVHFPTQYDNKNRKIKDFGENRNKLVLHFLEIANKYDPIMTFPIALQFFGGLRRSEVVNLCKSSMYIENRKLFAIIEDNQEKLFSNRNSADLQVKRPRSQNFINNEILIELFNKHIQIIERIKNKNKYALIPSSQNNNTGCNGKQYANKFNKIKKRFLESLLENENIEEYHLLSKNNWSTHICRGVFTNILISSGFGENELMLARGDKNPKSSQSYLDEHTMYENMDLVINYFDKGDILHFEKSLHFNRGSSINESK